MLVPRSDNAVAAILQQAEASDLVGSHLPYLRPAGTVVIISDQTEIQVDDCVVVENPGTILGPYVEPGSTVVDVGCAMGFHSLDLARLVGPDGRVVCLDIQQKMLDRLVKRARRKGLDTIIEARLCTQEGLELDDLDGTAELVRRLAHGEPSLRLIRRIGRAGLASAIKEGLLDATGDVAVVMDSDGQHDRGENQQSDRGSQNIE